MRRVALLLCLILGVVAPLAALDAYPKTTLAEDGTATWCQYCPQAYAGLDVVHSNYNCGEFLSARYYETSGGLGTAETDAALAYYGIGGFPTVVFNGLIKVVGGGAGIASGGPYLSIVGAAYFDPAPIRIEIDSFDPASGDIQATVTMYSETEVLAADHIRFLLLEDHVWYTDPSQGTHEHFHVTRDIINDTITLSGAGNTAVFNTSFDVDPSWVTANLHAVVFVQRAADKEVLQAVSTFPEPDYTVRAIVPFSRMKMGPSSGSYSSPHFTVTNTGLADTFTINVLVDDGPPSWNINYCDGNGTCHIGEWSFDLGLDGSIEFYANVTPDSPGYMRYYFEITSPNLTSPLVIPFTYTTDDANVLIVDDDGAEDYENYYTAALDTLGLSYGMWDRSFTDSELTTEVLQAYRLLIWEAGLNYPTLDPEDRDFLSQHLENGGSLFLTGQDIGWELNYSSSGNYDPAWYHTYLHANWVNDDTNIYWLDGVAGDPITDGMDLHIQGGDGANNQEYPDAIAPRDADATTILSYRSSSYKGAIRATDSTSGARVVYLGFGYEAIDNPQGRADLLGRALEWMGVNELFVDGFESGDTSMWSVTVP